MIVTMNAVKTILKTMACGWIFSALIPLAVSAAPIDDYFIAIKNDNDGALVTVLFRGFDVNTLDSEGRHGLHIAMVEGSFKVAKTLLDLSGTKVDTRSKSDESPLMMAALKGHTEFAKRLIKRGADVNKTGWTPLHYAATSGHLAMIELLLDEDAYIDAESPNKTTPLMMAALYGSEAATKLLLKEGADAGIKNDQGLTAADFALQADRKELSVELKKAAIAIKAQQKADAAKAAQSAPPASVPPAQPAPVQSAPPQPLEQPVTSTPIETK